MTCEGFKYHLKNDNMVNGLQLTRLVMDNGSQYNNIKLLLFTIYIESR